MAKETLYNITISVKKDRLTEHAAETIPKAIKACMRDLKVKLMLISGETAVPMDCEVQEFGGEYREWKLDLSEE